MATIITINAADQITNSRADLNTNFANLNSDKIETSYIDTDTSLAANSDSKIATQKATKAYIDSIANAALSTEYTASSTHSLTTVADQRVLVIAKGNYVLSGTETSIILKYNGINKDFSNIKGTNGDKQAFCLLYTETPGAATANVTVEAAAGSFEQVVIMAMKFNV